MERLIKKRYDVSYGTIKFITHTCPKGEITEKLRGMLNLRLMKVTHPRRRQHAKLVPYLRVSCYEQKSTNVVPTSSENS
jgi:hypothetical protein